MAQEDSPAATTNRAKDIDPQAVAILKASLAPIEKAKSFSFSALLTRDHLGTNGQVVTLFETSKVTVQRPDKMRIDFSGQGQDVELLHNAGKGVLYTPAEHVYASVKSPPMLDAALIALEAHGIFLPMANFLVSDPFESLRKDLSSANVVGTVKVFDQDVYHLVFTEPGAEWQLWVSMDEVPRVVRMQVIDRSKTYMPRHVIQFLEWDLEANPKESYFTFTPPPDAKQIQLTAADRRKP
jgi:hypothetical protein